MSTAPLVGKSALVTGGARRIGRSIALELAQAGANVAVTWLNSQAEAQKTAQDMEALGVRAQALQCDVRVENSVRRTVDATAAAFGSLDVLVNNAAVFVTTPIEQICLEEWDAVFATNARGPFLMARHALPHLRKAGGRIVNIGSLGGMRAWAGHAHYCSSKAALHMLTQTMAKAFAPEVTVNCVAPGWIDGGEEAGDETGDRAARLAQKAPMRRSGTAEDVAQAVVFFASGPSFITGQVLAVDGGLGLV